MSSGIRVIPPEDSQPGLPKFPPLDVLPCANVNVDKYFVCKNRGKQACSSCRLVSYCSKECQKAHWVIHKSDCEDRIISSDWKPGWVVEGRPPSFLLQDNVSTADEFAFLRQERLSLGASLWGNIPAMDIVNLTNNEKGLDVNLSLAFAGDIRNIITTVNALGSDYSRQLTILLNDINPFIVSRNIALLLILGTIPDEAIAADIALHFWYSVFMPIEYRLRILSMVSTFLKEGKTTSPIVAHLGLHSTLTCQITDEVRRLLMENAGPLISQEQAQAEYRRVRMAPSRADFRDRMYMGLKPSHRLAFLEYRRFGIVLPFGALNAHFNAPNPSLFAGGMWLQTDYADPLESWDLEKVFTAGRAHGAQPEDVYGCLYFFLSDQLQAFAKHIRQHRISFHVFSLEACALAQGILQGRYIEYNIPSTVRFDRIDVSNIMDPNYVGIRPVMNSWGQLLAKTDNSALTGYFMNWVAYTEKASLADAGPSALRNAMATMRSKRIRPPNMDPLVATKFMMGILDAFNDTSKPFSKFWKDHGGDEVKLQLRTVHRIVPHRLGTAISAKPDALPDFGDDESLYRRTQLTSRTWTERFVELVNGKARS